MSAKKIAEWSEAVAALLVAALLVAACVPVVIALWRWALR